MKLFCIHHVPKATLASFKFGFTRQLLCRAALVPFAAALGKQSKKKEKEQRPRKQARGSRDGPPPLAPHLDPDLSALNGRRERRRCSRTELKNACIRFRLSRTCLF